MFPTHPGQSRAVLPLLAFSLFGCCAIPMLLMGPHDGGGPDHGNAQQAPQAAVPQFKGDPYLLDTDPVSGKSLGPIDAQVVIELDGREFRFSSQENAELFKAESAQYLPAVDAKLIEQQKPFYPLDTCLVSGEKLGGEMGGPIDFVYRNRLLRFCCKECQPEFLKDPAKFVAKLDQAVIAKQAAAYPATACVVSGEKLGGDMGPAVDVVVGNRLIRFCCTDCQKDFRKDPLKYLGKLGAGQPAGQGHAPGHEDGGHEHGHDDPHGGGGR